MLLRERSHPDSGLVRYPGTCLLLSIAIPAIEQTDPPSSYPVSALRIGESRALSGHFSSASEGKRWRGSTPCGSVRRLECFSVRFECEVRDVSALWSGE